MKKVIFSAITLLSLLSSTTITGQETEFTLSDFQELHQLSGIWKGMAGNSAFYESFESKSDTLLVISSFSDAALSRKSGSGEVYFKDGQILHTNGRSKWKVSKKENGTWYFEPVQNATNRFSWMLRNPAEWTAVVGNNIYEMKKIR